MPERSPSVMPLVMGIVNVTPDSFSDGGRFLEADAAVAHGLQLLAEGAAILDVGGESTRPGAAPVPVDEEIRRVIPVVERLVEHGRVSIDTRRAEVARAAVGVGATLINDVSASLWPVAAELGVGWVAMHMQGEPGTMQAEPTYTDVVAEVAPEGKVDEVQRLRASGAVVAMVGDGVNDAAALASADLGLAMGTGTDAAIEASDLTLVSGDLRTAATAIRLARRTLRTIRGNLVWAFGYNVAMIPLAMAGLLTPLLAGAAMALSSVFVVSNSLRLKTFR